MDIGIKQGALKAFVQFLNNYEYYVLRKYNAYVDLPINFRSLRDK
jgi:hypothetical protein